jgi:hypothetical protein
MLWSNQGKAVDFKECIQNSGIQPLGRMRTRWKDNINMDLQEVSCGDGKGMEVAQDCVQWWTLVVMVSNIWFLLPEN